MKSAKITLTLSYSYINPKGASMDSSQEVTSEISLLDLYHIVINKIWFILIITMTSTILAASYAWFVETPMYRSRADVMVQIEQATGSTDPNFDYANAFRLIDTVAELMEKEVVYVIANETLVNEGFISVDHGYFQTGTSVNASQTSYFINVSFLDADPLYAQAAVDAIIDAVIEVTDEEGAFPVLTDKIRRTSFATTAGYASPNRVTTAIIGFVIGAVASVGFVLMIELFSTSFKSKEEIEKTLNLQIIGIIPQMDMKVIKTNGKK